MPTVATAVVKIAADIGDFDKGMQKANATLLKTGENITSWGRKLSVGVTAPLVALSGALAKSAADDAASLAKLDRAFGAGAKGMEAFVGKMMTVSPQTASHLREIVSGTEAFSLSLGLSGAKATEMTKRITTLAADLAAYNHVDQSVAQEALEHALAGKTKALVGLNVVVSEAEIKAKGFAAIEARAASMHGEAARTIGEDVNAWARLKQSTDEAASSWGAVVLPTFVKILDTAGAAAKRLGEMDGATKGLVVSIGTAAVVAGPLLIVTGKLVTTFTALRAATMALSAGNGIAGLAGTLTGFAGIAALILAPMVAVAHAFDMEGEAARNAKKLTDDYRASLATLTPAQLKLQAGVNTKAAAGLEARRLGLIAQVNALPQAGTPGYDTETTPATLQKLGTDLNFVTTQQTFFATAAQQANAELKRQNDATKAATAALGQFTKMPFDLLIDRAKALNDLGGTTGVLADILNKLTGAYRSIVSDSTTEGLKHQAELWKTIEASTAGIAGDLPGIARVMLQGENTAALRTGVANRNETLAHMVDFNGKLVPIAPGVPNLTTTPTGPKGGPDDTTLRDGFADVTKAIGETLADKLVSSLVGAGNGANFGGNLGQQFGNRIGEHFGKTAGALGSAAFPIVGALIGTVAGGILGGLFDHKKHVDANTAALNKLTESIVNSPAGFKVDPFRFAASSTYSYNPFTQSAPGTDSASLGGIVIHTLTVVANDPVQFARSMGNANRVASARGGSTGLALAGS